MRWCVVDCLLIAVYGTRTPTPAEWGEYLGMVERQGILRTRQLVYTDGGGPNTAQRSELTRLMGGQSIPVAVVSDDRGSVSTTVRILSWFNKDIAIFRTQDFTLALQHLGVPTSRADLLWGRIEELRGAIKLERAAS